MNYGELFVSCRGFLFSNFLDVEEICIYLQKLTHKLFEIMKNFVLKVGVVVAAFGFVSLPVSAESYKSPVSRLRPVLSGFAGLRSHGVQPVTRAGTAPMRQVPEDGREYETVIYEDFSLMTAGSEDDPDKNYIENDDYSIPSQYTHQPGWSGRGIMQAGGAVCIGKVTDPYTSKEMTGQIETPVTDLHRDNGKAYLSFRAKSLRPDVDMLTIRWVTDDVMGSVGEEQTTYINGTVWSTVNVDLTKCPENAIIQIWSEYNEVLIDDIKVEQYHSPIDSPKALKWTEYTGDSFVANWEAVEGADHYLLNVFYIRREGSEDQLPDYKYILTDYKTVETSHRLTGLDPDKVYLYYVYAVNDKGEVSEESQTVEVMALTVPDGIQIDRVKHESFSVSWNPVRNAEGYGFQAILTHTAQADEDYSLLDEPFDCIVSEGSVGDPYTNAIGYYDMDSYGLSRANWVMYEGGVIDGGICLHNYVSSYGEDYYGELVSPILTIGESTGEITLEGDFASLDGVRPYIQIAVPGVVDGKTQWVLGAGGEIQTEIGKEWTTVKQTYKVKPGLVRFSIGCTDGGWLYIDRLSLAVRLPEGAKQTLPYHYNETKELEFPHYTCPTPDRSAGDKYSFALMAARQKPGSFMIPVYVTSDWSDLVEVPDPMSSVSVPSGSGALDVKVAAGGVAIENPGCGVVTVADVAGRVVVSTDAAYEEVALVPGIYIIRSEQGSCKIYVK